MPSARVEIDGGKGGFRSGVLYSELPGLMRELYEAGVPAIAYAVGGNGLIVGESDPTIADRWHALDKAPLAGLRDKTGNPA